MDEVSKEERLTLHEKRAKDLSPSTEQPRQENIEEVLNKLLDPSIGDETKVLEVLVDAITLRSTDENLVRQAIRQAVHNYENRLRVFMVAVANTQLRRILRLIRTIDRFEEELNKEEVLAAMRPCDLIKAYALQQANLVQSLDYIKRIVDMRLELQQATASVMATLSSQDVKEIDSMSGLPKLGAQQRDRVRAIVENMVSSIDEDEKIIEETMIDGFLPPGKSNGERE